MRTKRMNSCSAAADSCVVDDGSDTTEVLHPEQTLDPIINDWSDSTQITELTPEVLAMARLVRAQRRERRAANQPVTDSCVQRVAERIVDDE